MEVIIPYLQDETEEIYIGDVFLTEVKVFLEADGEDALKLAVGYGLVMGKMVAGVPAKKIDVRFSEDLMVKIEKK